MKKRAEKLKVFKPDLKVMVSKNPTPSMENCSQVFIDPENKMLIRNSFGGSVAARKTQEQKASVPRPASAADNDVFEVNAVYVSFFSSTGCSIIVSTQFPSEKEAVAPSGNRAKNSKSIRAKYIKEITQLVEELAADSYGQDKYLEALKAKQKAFHTKGVYAEDFIK